MTNPTFLREPARAVVAMLLTHRGRICLLRRSERVGSDVGRWHCITGFLDPGVSPAGHVLTELAEETGLTVDDLDWWRHETDLVLPDARSGSWRVHVYRAEVSDPRVALNWEHDAVRWVPWSAAADLGRDLVPWLGEVVAATDIGRPAAA
jgi:8-oxo-dGTP pyrophosphatase MutT (NUDIX family)